MCRVLICCICALVVMTTFCFSTGTYAGRSAEIEYSTLGWAIVHSHAFVVQNETWPWTSSRPLNKAYSQAHVPAGTIIKVGDCTPVKDHTGKRKYCSFVSEIGVSGRIRDDLFDYLESGIYFVSLERNRNIELISVENDAVYSEFSMERGAYVKLPAGTDPKNPWPSGRHLEVVIPPSKSPHWGREREKTESYAIDKSEIETNYRIIDVNLDSDKVTSFRSYGGSGGAQIDPKRVSIWEYRPLVSSMKDDMLKKISLDLGWLEEVQETAESSLKQLYDNSVSILRHVSCSSSASVQVSAGLSFLGNAIQGIGDVAVWEKGWSISTDMISIMRDGKAIFWVLSMNVAKCHESPSAFMSEPAYIQLSRVYVVREKQITGTPKLVSDALAQLDLRRPVNAIDEEAPDFVVIERNDHYRSAIRYFRDVILASQVSDFLDEDEVNALSHGLLHRLGFFPPGSLRANLRVSRE